MQDTRHTGKDHEDGMLNALNCVRFTLSQNTASRGNSLAAGAT